MVTVGIFPFKENSHGRAGSQTRDLMISSQRLWPLDHEAGPIYQYIKLKSHVYCNIGRFFSCGSFGILLCALKYTALVSVMDLSSFALELILYTLLFMCVCVS